MTRIREEEEATNQSTQQFKASHGLSAIAELLVLLTRILDYRLNNVCLWAIEREKIYLLIRHTSDLHDTTTAVQCSVITLHCTAVSCSGKWRLIKPPLATARAA